ncbi:MAG TPA: metallopeptidase TldD-related protein [Thermoanaerobaculia bacterium]|nr:metallopeptidase TldD-related protein [Thermoanaerobaculia bacterium]
MAHALSPHPLAPVEEMVARLDRVLAGSPADETELVWIEARRNVESNGKRRGEGGDGSKSGGDSQERTVLVRVREAGRVGLHRTGFTGLSDLEKAVREALAQARFGQPAPPTRLPDGAADALPAATPSNIVCDAEIPRLTPARVKEVIQRTAETGEVARLGWAEGRFAVVNSRGLRRSAQVTAAWMDVRCSQAPGAGRATAVARTLAALDAPAVFARARQNHPAAGSGGEIPPGPLPPAAMVLAPEAVAALLDLLNRHALSSLSFLDGASCLCGRIGQEVFHPAINLRDDPLAPCGAPFPFDLLGSAKRPLDLVRRGVFLAPPRDQRLAQELALAPTAHLVAPDEALCSHLSLEPGELSGAELLGHADGGLWIGELDPVEAFEPRALRFRAVARGVRRITGGALGPGLPDLLWEDCLPALLTRVLGVGNQAAPVVPSPDCVPLLGAFCMPALALAAVAGLHGLRREATPRS